MSDVTIQSSVWTNHRADSLLSLLHGALSLRNQASWSRWLQGEIQVFLPHDALIAAWGDFASGEVSYDVITRSPTLASCAWAKHEIEPMMLTLFARWVAAQQQPVALEPESLFGSNHGFPFGRCALVHGVQDHRSHYDSMYLFLGPEELGSPFAHQLCRMVLPFIDLGLRQLPDRGQKRAQVELSGTGFASSSFAEAMGSDRSSTAEAMDSGFGYPGWADAAPGERGSRLSAREVEIMQWVRMGKTNAEIATILNLSTFTVKNHMRRIYRKLDVLNRAQAVGSLDRLQSPARPALR